jgi:hypothetical protein
VASAALLAAANEAALLGPPLGRGAPWQRRAATCTTATTRYDHDQKVLTFLLASALSAAQKV